MTYIEAYNMYKQAAQVNAPAAPAAQAAKATVTVTPVTANITKYSPDSPELAKYKLNSAQYKELLQAVKRGGGIKDLVKKYGQRPDGSLYQQAPSRRAFIQPSPGTVIKE